MSLHGKYKGVLDILKILVVILIIFSNNRKKLTNGKAVTYKTKLTNNVMFMVSSLSNFADNLAKGLHKLNTKTANFVFNM